MRHSVWSLGAPLSVDGPRAAQSSGDYDYETKPNPSDCPASENRPIIGLFVMAAWKVRMFWGVRTRAGAEIRCGRGYRRRSILATISNALADDSTIADLDFWGRYPWTH
jgi:hypothetical protein